jgi:hypothetical protein
MLTADAVNNDGGPFNEGRENNYQGIQEEERESEEGGAQQQQESVEEDQSYNN